MSDADDIAKLEDRLNKHLIQYAEDRTRDDLRHEQVMLELETLTKVTADVVNAWKVANGFQKFVKWLSGFALLGVGITWLADKLP